jgi:PhnB protein
MTQLNPYISFKNTARNAMEFYQTVFGGKLTMTTFKDGKAPSDPSEENNIMHSQLETDNGIIFMAADTPSGMEYHPGMNMSMSLSGDDEVELKKYWEKLSSGASIEQPLVKAPWGDTFGMLRDKFGIHWMVNINSKKS